MIFNRFHYSPYTRPTYRYTPLLAVLMTPNMFLHPAFGKLLFATCDILMSLVLFRLAQRTAKESANIRVSLLHLLNPLIFSISTRGSSESVLGMFVLATLYYAIRGRWDATAIWFGLSVHWKIYPIIYGSSLLMLIGQGRRDWTLKARIRFGVIAATTFFSVGGLMYALSVALLTPFRRYTDAYMQLGSSFLGTYLFISFNTKRLQAQFLALFLPYIPIYG